MSPAMIRLDLIERRRRPSVADDRATVVALAITEPMPHYLFAGDFVVPHRLGNVCDISVPLNQLDCHVIEFCQRTDMTRRFFLHR